MGSMKFGPTATFRRSVYSADSIKRIFEENPTIFRWVLSIKVGRGKSVIDQVELEFMVMRHPCFERV